MASMVVYDDFMFYREGVYKHVTGSRSAKIKAKLAADGDINPFNIDVDTNQGEVVLQGVVKKEDTRRKAEQYARDTDGVVRVRNLIKVEGGGS